MKAVSALAIGVLLKQRREEVFAKKLPDCKVVKVKELDNFDLFHSFFRSRQINIQKVYLLQ